MNIWMIEKRCKNLKIKKIEKYHDLYVQNNRLLLPDVFENLRNMFLEIYELDPSKFLSTFGVAW